LNATAQVAASQPSEAPAPGQYVYTRTEGVGVMISSSGDGSTTTSSGPFTQEFWLGTDGSGERRGTRDGEPYIVRFAPGDLSFDDYSNLPSDPGKLSDLIHSGGLGGGNHPSDAVCFQTIAETLEQGYVSPAVRSALYQVAAEISGVELEGNVTDHIGRQGVEVSYTHAGTRRGLIFDPSTSEVLEDNLSSGPAPSAGSSYTVFVESGVVGSIGERP
jgi:hypothetical protein